MARITTLDRDALDSLGYAHALAGGFFDLSIMLPGIDLSLFDSFDMFWGTGDCGNDAIWGTVAFVPPPGTPVDAPPAAGLMLLGLLGLVGLRTRRRPVETAN